MVGNVTPPSHTRGSVAGMERSEPLRVAYVSMQFPAPSETFAATDVRALIERGDAVTVFAMRPPHAHHEQMLAERSLTNADVRPMTWPRALRGLGLILTRPAWTASTLAWAVRWNRSEPRHLLSTVALMPSAFVIFDDLRRGRYDVLHLFWGHYPTMVGHLAHRFAPGVVRSVFLGAYDLVMEYGGSRPVARAADAVWTHARVNRPALQALGVPDETTHVGYRGVDVHRLASLREAEEAGRQAGSIVAVARLIASKGMDDVIRAFALVRDRLPQATLTLVGDGPERPALEALAGQLGVAGATQFVGHVAHDEVLRIMARTDVFVLLSTKPDERLPNAVKEAMALGCVCVVSRTPGIEELVDHGRTGFIVEPIEPERVATWIERAVAGGDNENVRRDALAHVSVAFDAARTMAGYHQTWAALAEAKRRGQEVRHRESPG